VQGALGEFAMLMQAQLDMRVEAENLRRLRKNFEGSTVITFPEPLGHTSEHVLIESFIHGEPISK
jgi:predicted unusual protein kinase regulating ubiquinone biosynthesis (AarF/ABC1/UbiB family)